jgi:protein transport protein SEC24
MCNLTNDVPQSFDWDSAKQASVDRWQRPELNYSVSEFVAPQEYMVRAPQPLIYLFLFDVSYAGVTSGLLATAARCILESLDRIPNTDRRTRLGFMAVDSSLHYFSIPRDGSENNDPKMLVVSDLDEPFLPTPEDLLVNLTECRANIETYLTKLQGMFANTQDNGSAMGSALRAGHKLISHVGGKAVCLSASLPNIGHGKLEMREDKKLLGTSKENALLQTQNSFYKSFAVECSKTQVSIDMFLFSAQYQDVASLSNLPRYTGGQTYFYPAWNAARTEDAIKFATEFSDYLSSEIGLEAVLRVRTTTGLRPSAFYGNFFNRSSDLCAFPAMPRDQAYVVEIAIDESVTKAFACLQVGVLHTTCNGERRIRVLTLSIPTTQNLAEVYASADQQAITHYFAHKAVERALSSGLDAARDAVQAKIIELLQTYKKELGGGNMGGGGLQFPANLRGLPMLFLGLMKNVSTCSISLIHPALTSFVARPPQVCTDPYRPPLCRALPPLYPSPSSAYAIHLPPPLLFARHARRRWSPSPRNRRNRHASTPQPLFRQPRPLRSLPPRRRPDSIPLARPRRRPRSYRRRLRHRGQEPAQARQDFNPGHRLRDERARARRRREEPRPQGQGLRQHHRSSSLPHPRGRRA